MALWLGVPTRRLFFSDKLVLLSCWLISPPLVEISGGVYGEFWVKVMYMESDCHIRGNSAAWSPLMCYLYICRVLKLACWVYDHKKNLIYRVLRFPSQKRSHFTGKSPLLWMIVQLCKLWAFHGLLLLLSSDCSYQTQHFIFLNMSGLNVIHHNSHSKLLCHLSDYLALILALFSGRRWRPKIVWGSWMAEIILTVYDKDLAPANRASIPE